MLPRMYGKIIGAMIGGAAGLLLSWHPAVASGLAVVGFALGHFLIDREAPLPKSEAPTIDELLGEEQLEPRLRRARRRPPPKPRAPQLAEPTAEQTALANALCPIFMEVARADGAVVQPEIRVVRELFQHELQFDEPGMEAVRAALKASLAGPHAELEALVRSARSSVKPAARLAVVNALYDMAQVDGEVRRSEADALRVVVQHFNLGEAQVKEITTRFFGAGDRHYRTLGLTEAASDDEIRAAFRRLATESHPDRVAALGPQEAEAAAERFRQVKDAYEELRKIRGF